MMLLLGISPQEAKLQVDEMTRMSMRAAPVTIASTNVSKYVCNILMIRTFFIHRLIEHFK